MTEHDFVRMTACPEDYQILVTGDPARDHVLIFGQNAFMGPPTSRKIQLPDNWLQMLEGK
jgi:hypothetical protein